MKGYLKYFRVFLFLATICSLISLAILTILLVRGHTGLELLWSLTPFVILGVVTVFFLLSVVVIEFIMPAVWWLWDKFVPPGTFDD
jgi:hypothetical protein